MKSKGLNKPIQMGEALLRVLGNDRFEWQTVRILLAICQHGGEMPMKEIEKVTGWSQAAVSRNVAKLGNGITMDDPGARLIEAYEDPAYRRRKIVRLTARGRALCVELNSIFE